MKRVILIILLLMFLPFVAMKPFFSSGTFCGPYTFHAPITTATNGSTISGDSLTSITLTGVSNVHITKCKIANNTTGIAIKLFNCTNITIDSCYFTNDQQGVYAQSSVSIKVNGNYFYKITGDPAHTYHPIQFDTNTGGGQQINNNMIEETSSEPYTHDQISVFGSTGLAGDSIQVLGNTIRGGQLIENGTGTGGRTGANNGACGIGVDIGTTYCVVRGNYLINTGYAGIQIIGSGIDHIKVDHNYVYSSQTDVSFLGLSFQVSSYTACYVGYNHLNWTTYNGTIQNIYGTSSPTGWSTNTANTTPDGLATSTMIANPQVASCTIAPVISYSPSTNTYTVGTTISTLTPTNTGGAATSYSISPSLSAGLALDTSTGNITGTPTASASLTNYTITATNGGGSGTTTLTLTVNGITATVIKRKIIAL